MTNTGESILEALDLEERYRISFWDALIVQAAERSGASILYSEDLSEGQTYASVRILNPLRDEQRLKSPQVEVRANGETP